MYDLTHISKFIFQDKDEYNKLSDEEKDKFFFIINRKLARMFPYHSQFVNKYKDMDKASALDIWYYFFIKKRIRGVPGWYWGTKKKSVVKEHNYKKIEIDFLTKFYDITESDIEYLVKYHPNEVEEEVKKFRKFNKTND